MKEYQNLIAAVILGASLLTAAFWLSSAIQTHGHNVNYGAGAIAERIRDAGQSIANKR